MYTTPYGPIIDGVVIPADPELLMADPGAGNNYFKFQFICNICKIVYRQLYSFSLDINNNYVITAKHMLYDKSIIQQRVILSLLKYLA